LGGNVKTLKNGEMLMYGLTDSNGNMFAAYTPGDTTKK
jgi:hypothetical protein